MEYCASVGQERKGCSSGSRVGSCSFLVNLMLGCGRKSENWTKWGGWRER